MVDVVMPSDENRGVFLLRRASDPHEGFSALPGGFAQLGERLEEAAVRIAEDEAGLRAEVIRLIGVYSDPIVTLVNTK